MVGYAGNLPLLNIAWKAYEASNKAVRPKDQGAFETDQQFADRLAQEHTLKKLGLYRTHQSKQLRAMHGVSVTSRGKKNAKAKRSTKARRVRRS
jgi:hypothetical protein